MAFALFMVATGGAAAPDVPPAIAVPPGHAPLFQWRAAGVQIYKAAPDEAGKLAWVLQGPLATLSDDKGVVAAYHFEGPTWEAVDGSRVARDPAEPVRSAAAPDPGHDVPWLLVKVKADPAPGRLAGAAYVQRLNTVGGKPPRGAPARAGTWVGMPYTATYRFFGQSG